MRKMTAFLLSAAMLWSAVSSVVAAGVSYNADFEDAETKFGKGTTYSGFKNTAADYSDFIKASWVAEEGKDKSTGLEISYKSATWYAGEVFFLIPSVWNMSSDLKYLNFDYKGKGSVKINLSTGKAEDDTLTNGTRYGYKITVDSPNEWQSISIPLSEFVNGTTSVTITDIGAVTFQAGENGNLSNNAAETKAMTAAELEAKAKAGVIVFDNMTLSSEEGKTTVDPSAPTPTPTPTPKPDDSVKVIDFDTTSLSVKQTWAGFKNNAGDYSDFIKPAVTENGKNGKGFEISYTSATWYSGEVFAAIPTKWAINSGAKYVEFDAKGKAKLKIALETGEVINGTRYEARVDIDTDNEWKTYSIPVSTFVNNGTAVTLSEVTGMTFKAAESGNLNNNDADVKAMSADALSAAAVSGSVVLDNITLKDIATVKPYANTVLIQNGGVLDKYTDAQDGKITVKVSVGNAGESLDVTVVAAVFENGLIDKVKIKKAEIISTGDITFDITAESAAGKTMKVFVYDNFGKLTPVSEVAVF